MERLAKGAGCKPLQSSISLEPQCQDSDHYSPAFWPDRLSQPGHAAAATAAASTTSSVLLEDNGDIDGEGRASQGLRGGSAGDFDGSLKNRSSYIRVVVATDDPGIEELLEEYKVGGTSRRGGERGQKLFLIICSKYRWPVELLMIG